MQITKCSSATLNSNYKQNKSNNNLYFNAVYGSKNIFRIEGGEEARLREAADTILSKISKMLSDITETKHPMTVNQQDDLAAHVQAFNKASDGYEREKQLNNEMAAMVAQTRTSDG